MNVTVLPLRIVIGVRDRDIAASYERALEAEAHVVHWENNGFDLLMAVNALAPDVLVVERDLPWGGGDGVIANLREEGRHVPVTLLLSAAAPLSAENLVRKIEAEWATHDEGEEVFAESSRRQVA